MKIQTALTLALACFASWSAPAHAKDPQTKDPALGKTTFFTYERRRSPGQLASKTPGSPRRALGPIIVDFGEFGTLSRTLANGTLSVEIANKNLVYVKDKNSNYVATHVIR